MIDINNDGWLDIYVCKSGSLKSHENRKNKLFINQKDNTFKESAAKYGLDHYGFSTQAYFFDFDKDLDMYLVNHRQDFRNQMRNNIRNRKKVSLEQAINMMPSHKLSNYIFKNNKDFTFKNNTKKWGLDLKINSNGAAYADLDNDGDLDLIVNNQAEIASVYINNSTKNSVSFALKGSQKNKFGIGTKITVFSDGLQQSKEHFVSRGFQSSIRKI